MIDVKLTPLEISVVICAYADERWECLLEAIQSIFNQTMLPLEIVVIIDHNPRLFARLQHTALGITVTENHETRGLSGARNTGIAVSNGRAIAFLDDDATAAPDWLEKLSYWFRYPDIVGVGGSVEPNWETMAPAWFPKEFGWVLGCSYRGQPKNSSRVRNLFGGCMCVRRAAFELAGGFRSAIGRANGRPMGCEETELCIRVQQKNPAWQFVYEPQARIYHNIPAARSTWSYFRQRCYAEGLSKAQVSRLVGVADGLSTERSYVTRTLPLGVLRGVGDFLRQGNASGLARSGAIVTGLAYTFAGYVTGLRNQQLMRFDQLESQA
jgi:GT2 family glycosyltransferase